MHIPYCIYSKIQKKNNVWGDQKRFGRDYSYNGIESSDVTVSKLGNSIIAEWSVKDITVKQTLGLLDETASQHGMVSIDYEFTTQSEDIDNVKVRVMLDTALGEQDYGYYQLPDTNNEYRSISNECIVDNTGIYGYKGTFFAVDDPKAPKVNAYTIDVAVKGEVVKPYQVAFGHWNSLASTVFDFTPDESLNFTNQYNMQYMTADSAYALYYDLGKLNKGETANISTYYGVYSNSTVSTEESVSINFISLPSSMLLNEDKTEYVSQVENGKEGDIKLQLIVENITGYKKNNITLVVKTMNNVTPYVDWYSGMIGDENSDYTETRSDVQPGEELTFEMFFNVTPLKASEYRTFEILCYEAAEGEELTEGKLLGSRKFYLFCPGELGEVVLFNSISPQVIHYEGTRRIYLAGQNIGLMKDTTAYTTILHPVAGGEDVVVPAKNVIVDANNNSMYLIVDTEMVPGGYQVIFDWNEVGKENLTATALQFQVSDKPKYVAPTYGIVTIEKAENFNESKPKYTVGYYADEKEYKNKVPNSNQTVYLEFRGDFGVRYDADGNLVELKAASLTDVYDKVLNTITISECIDVEAGFVSINIEDYGKDSQSINVDIDGKVYTSTSRTIIWDGVCALTTIKNGSLYKLPQYSYNGELLTDVENGVFNAKTISLMWPGAAGIAKTLAGVVFKFRYAEFAMIATVPGDVTLSTPRERIISFGAKMSPGFLIPKGYNWNEKEQSALEKAESNFAKSNYTPNQLRDVNNRYSTSQQQWVKDKKGTLNIYVDNILFGKRGFIGFNTSIEVGIPSYTSGMPEIGGKLDLKILPAIDYWEVGLEGKADFIALKVEAAITLKKAYGGVPGVDKLYFYVEGSTPGINVDGFGVFWIKGLGGGIDNVYYTIYAVSKVPQISILFSGKFSLFSVLDARADLAISPRGFSVKFSELGISGVTLVEEIGIKLAWYPDISFYGNVKINIFDIIVGGGYIAVEKDERTGEYFYEGYATATLKTPKLPVIGSVKVGNAALGVNTDKIWGNLKVIGVKLGVIYYWGGDVDFGIGKEYVPKPTYPLALAATPVGVDEKTGNTVYMLLATNVEKLLGDNNKDTYITSSVDRMNHVIDLGDYKQSRDLMLSMTFEADSLAEAEAFVKGDKYGNTGIVLEATDDNSITYPLSWLDMSKDIDGQDNTNALMFYDEETKKVTVTISFTETEAHNHKWKFSVAKSADVVMYEMNKMASLDDISYTYNVNTNEMNVSWNGSKLEDMERLSISAIDEEGNKHVLYDTYDSGVICGNLANATSGKTTFKVSPSLPGGKYTIQVAAGSEAKNVCNIIESEVVFIYENENQPEKPTISGISLGGDYSIDANVEGDNITEGYVVTVYEKQINNGVTNWVVSSIGAQYIEADENGTLPEIITVGGKYDTIIYVDKDGNRVSPAEAETRDDVTTLNATIGLEAGKTYRLGIMAYNQDDKGNELFSKEVFSGEVLMKEPVKPNVEVSITGSMSLPDKTETADKIDYVTSDVIEVLVSSDMAVSGQWSLDAGEIKGNFVASNDAKIIIGASDNGLEEGEHSLTLTGTNESGDAFVVEYRFYVKTVAPRLQLSSPYAGSFFGEEIKVTGISEAGSKVYILLDGAQCGSVAVDDNNQFEYTVKMDKSRYSQVISVYAENELGIKSYKHNISLINNLVSAHDVSLAIYVDGVDYTNKTIPAGTTGKLELRAVSEENSLIIPNNSLLGSQAEWMLHVVEGNASINNMNLTTDEDVNGMLMVSFEGYDIATVLGGNPTEYVKYEISLPVENNIFTITKLTDILVEDGGSFLFMVEISDGYVASDEFVVKANDNVIEANENGIYVIKDIKENIAVTVDGIKFADAVLSELPVANDLTYTGSEQKLITAGVTNQGTIMYSDSHDGTYAQEIPTGVNAGTYTVWYYVKGDEVHMDSEKAYINVTIKEASIASDDFDIKLPTELTYNGASQKPEVTVKYNDITLVPDEDYTVSYMDNINVGVATVIIQGKGNYTGSVNKTFAIIDRTKQVLELSYIYKENVDKSVMVIIGDCTFDKLVNGDYVLVEGVDYVIETDGKLTIKATYLESIIPSETPYLFEMFVTPDGGVQLSHGVIKATISRAEGEISYIEELSKVYDEKESKVPGITTTNSTEDTDAVKVEFKKKSADDSAYTTVAPKDAGEYTVRVTVKADEYYNSVTKTADFIIRKAADISSMESIIMPETIINGLYTSETLADITLPEGWKWQDEAKKLKAGDKITATAVYAGNGYQNYENVSYDVTVTKPHEVVKLNANNLTYNSKAQLLVNGISIEKGTLKYSMTENGIYTENIPTGIDAGTYTVWYYILSIDSEADFKFTLSESVDYDGMEKKPKVTVLFEDKNLKSGADYAVTYRDNINVGTATVVIEGKGNFEGTVEKTFIIRAIPGKEDGVISYIEDLSKVYDGKDVKIPEIITTNSTVDVDSVKVEFKKKSADDSMYTTVAPKNAGEYTLRVTVRADEKYNLVTKTADFTISKATNVWDIEGNIKPELVINVSYENDTLGDVTLPTGWQWKDNSIMLEAGKSTTVTAVYSNSDSVNYENVSIDIVVIRAEKEVVSTNDTSDWSMYMSLLVIMLVIFCCGGIFLSKEKMKKQ